MKKAIVITLVSLAGLLAVAGVNSGGSEKKTALWCAICMQWKPRCCQVAQVDVNTMTELRSSRLWRF